MYDQQLYAQPQQPHPYKKMGGWLMFLVVMAILGAIIKVFGLLGSSGIVNAFRQASIMGWGPVLDSLLNLAILAMSVVFIVTLFRRGARFLLFWQIGWIASLVKSLLFAADLASELLGTSTEDFLRAMEQAQPYRIAQLEELMAQTGLTMESLMPIIMGVTLAIGVGALLIIVLRFVFVTLYYRHSVRVRTYMGSDEYLRLAVFTRKAKPQPAVPDQIVTIQEASL